MFGERDDLAHRRVDFPSLGSGRRVAGCTSSGSSLRTPRARTALTCARCASAADAPARRTPARPISSIELGRVGAVDGLAADVRLGVAGAVPVEVVAAGTPAAAVVLGDRDLEVARAVGQLDRAEGAADRQLPADVGLERVRLARRSGRRAGAGRSPAPAGKPGRLRKMQAPSTTLRLAGAVLLLGPVVLAARGPADGWYCHSSSPSSSTAFSTRFQSSFVGEVRAERAAAVVGPAGVDALAAAAEDARPAARQPGQVAAEALVGVGGVGELDPDAREVQRCFSHRLTLCRRGFHRADDAHPLDGASPTHRPGYAVCPLDRRRGRSLRAPRQ